MHKIPDDQDTADIYTKYLSAQEMRKKLFNEDFTNVELRGPIGKRVVKKVSFDLSSNQVCVYASKAVSQFIPPLSCSVCSMSREDRNTWKMESGHGSHSSLRKTTQVTDNSSYHDDTYFPGPNEYGWEGECRWWGSPLPDNSEGGWYQWYGTDEYSGWSSSSPVKRSREQYDQQEWNEPEAPSPSRCCWSGRGGEWWQQGQDWRSSPRKSSVKQEEEAQSPPRQSSTQEGRQSESPRKFQWQGLVTTDKEKEAQDQ